MARQLQRLNWYGAHLEPSRSHLVFTNTPVFLAPCIAHSFAPISSRLLHRTFTSSSTRHQSPSISAERTTANPRLNPPPSTLPPLLVTPARSPDQSSISHYFSLGKAYLTFYKTGLKAVWTNFQTSRQLRARLTGDATDTSPKSASEALASGKLTRGEWQLLRRAEADVRKIPLFLLVFAICGEFTPLVVIFLSGVVPATCKIPKQVQRDRERREARRRTSFLEGSGLKGNDDLSGGNGAMTVDKLRPEQLAHVGRALGLYAGFWDRLLGGFPLAGTLKSRIVDWEGYVALDDTAIAKYGGFEGLDIEEIRIVAEERGIDVLGRDDRHLRNVVEKWMEESKKRPVLSMVLTRPSVWAAHAK